MAVVWGGGEEQPVFEVRCDQAQGLAKVAVFAERRRHQVVAFVHDQEVPGQMRGARWRTAGREELLTHVGLAQVVVRRDDAAERGPGVGVHAQAAPQLFGALPVHDIEPSARTSPTVRRAIAGAGKPA